MIDRQTDCTQTQRHNMSYYVGYIGQYICANERAGELCVNILKLVMAHHIIIIGIGHLLKFLNALFMKHIQRCFTQKK